MASLYTLRVVCEFAASHVLRDYPGECSRLHGHNWTVEVEVRAQRLDAVGMGVDFKAIRQATREVVDALDHRHLNDLTPFTADNPTAENIAAYIYREAGRRLNGEAVRVGAVTVWETARACVRYSEE